MDKAAAGYLHHQGLHPVTQAGVFTPSTAVGVMLDRAEDSLPHMASIASPHGVSTSVTSHGDMTLRHLTSAPSAAPPGGPGRHVPYSIHGLLGPNEAAAHGVLHHGI